MPPDRPITRLDPAQQRDYPPDRPLAISHHRSLDALLEPPLALIDQQWAFLTSPARFSLYIGGIGSGKTTAGCLRAIRLAFMQPGSLGLIGAPTYTMLRDTTQRMLLQLLPSWAIANYRHDDNHLTLINGSEILFRSLDDPDRLRGLNLAWYWLDEATLCGHYAWQILKGRLRQSGYRTTGIATATPHGRDGYWRDFEAEPRPGHCLYRATTADNASHLPADFIPDLGLTGAHYEQEVLGLFTAFQGLVYQLDTGPNGNVRDPSPEAEAAQSLSPRFVEVIGGIDWGFTNPAVALILARDGDDHWWVLEELYRRRAPLDGVLIPALVDLTRRHHVAAWFCGPDDPGAIAALSAALASEQLPAHVHKADNAIRPGIQTVTSLLAIRPDGTRGLYIAPRCVQTLSEFNCYAFATAPDGSANRDTAEEPIKQCDHCMDALRYALQSVVARRRRFANQLTALRQRRDASLPSRSTPCAPPPSARPHGSVFNTRNAHHVVPGEPCSPASATAASSASRASPRTALANA